MIQRRKNPPRSTPLNRLKPIVPVPIFSIGGADSVRHTCNDLGWLVIGNASPADPEFRRRRILRLRAWARLRGNLAFAPIVATVTA